MIHTTNDRNYQAIIQSGGEAVTVSDQEILDAVPEMASLSGVFPEPAAAAPWAAVKKLARNRAMDPNEVVVCIVSGSGLKDPAAASTAAGSPKLINPSLEAVSEALHRTASDPPEHARADQGRHIGVQNRAEGASVAGLDTAAHLFAGA